MLADNSAPSAVDYVPRVTNIPENTVMIMPLEVGAIHVMDDGLGHNELTLSGISADLFFIEGAALCLAPQVVLDAPGELLLTISAVDPTIQGSPPVQASVQIDIGHGNDGPTLAAASAVSIPVARPSSSVPTPGSTVGSVPLTGVFPSSAYSDPDDDEAGIAIIGTSLSGGDSGSIWYTIDPRSPTPLLGSGLFGTGWDVAIANDNNHAFVAAGLSDLWVMDIGGTGRPLEASQLALVGSAVGIALPPDEPHAYVASSTGGLNVVDVSNPAAPSLKGTLDTDGLAWGVDVSPDGKTLYVGVGRATNLKGGELWYSIDEGTSRQQVGQVSESSVLARYADTEACLQDVPASTDQAMRFHDLLTIKLWERSDHGPEPEPQSQPKLLQHGAPTRMARSPGLFHATPAVQS